MGWVNRSLLAVVAMAAMSFGGAVAAQEAGEAEIDTLITATETDAGALALARQQASGGDLTGAAVTLERSLLLRPGVESDPVRLYYASVLCRLGDPRRGAYQMAIVGSAETVGSAEARQACGSTPVATNARRVDGLRGAVSLGFGYETDAFGAMSVQFQTPGTPAIKQEGASVLGSAFVESRFAASASGHGYAGASLQSSHSVSGADIDYLIAAARAGYAADLSGRGEQLAAGAVVRHSRLLGDSFLSEYGAQAEYSFAGGAGGRWSVSAEAVNQDFEDSARDGGNYEVELSYRGTPSADHAWVLGVAVEVKEADLNALGYSGGRVFGATQMSISEGGAYLALSGVMRFAHYTDAPLLPNESETRSYLRAAVGMPVARENLFVEAAITHSARWYNHSSGLRDFNSVGAELRLVYRFGQ